jgi:beta-lactamase superfamily II metal-dependent hydrolase
MKMDVFDVGHGACTVLEAPIGRRIMVDCGFRSAPSSWWPSIHFYGESFDALLLTNLDEDHVGDFRDIRRNLLVKTAWINNTITAVNLVAMKPDGMRDGVRAVCEYLSRPAALNLGLDLSPIKVQLFRNSYGTFTDTNNLSLVAFVEYGNFCALFPGDLETAGWRALLRDPGLRQMLGKVNVFMASHHGRESGCCDEIFNYCRPDCFIMSDKEKVHDTQETTEWYRRHANGLIRLATASWLVPERRCVFTTRNDGCLSLDVELSGYFTLQIQSNRQNENRRLNRSLLTALAGAGR